HDLAQFVGDVSRARAGVKSGFAHVDEQGLAAGADDQLTVALFDVEDVNLKRARRPRSGTGAVRRADGGRGVGRGRPGIPITLAVPRGVGARRAGIGACVEHGGAVGIEQAHIVAAVVEETRVTVYVEPEGRDGGAGRDLAGRAPAGG